MRMVRGALSRNGIACRGEKRINIGTMTTLRECEYRFAIFAQGPTMSARPRTFRKAIESSVSVKGPPLNEIDTCFCTLI